jgi:hypothetical protein
MEEIEYPILYCVCENFFDSSLLRYGFGSDFGTVINYGTVPIPLRSVPYLNYGSGSVSATSKSYLRSPGKLNNLKRTSILRALG